MKTVGRFIFLILLLLLLTDCLSDLDNPVADAKAHRITVAADQAALDSLLDRSIIRADAEWTDAKRTEKAQYWASIEPMAQVAGQVLTVFVYIGFIGLVSVMAYSLSFASVKTAQAYGDFVTIRARLIHPDRETGIRPQIMWPETPMLDDPKLLFGRFTVRQFRPARWFLVDSMTEKHAVIDESQPASAEGQEIYRQLAMASQIAMHQGKTAYRSPDGEVAHAIGQSSVELPDAGQVFIEAAKQNLGVVEADNV